MQKLTKQGQSFRQTYRSLKLPTGAILVVLSLNQYKLYVSRVRVSSDLDRQNKITQEILAKYLQRRLFSHLLNTRAQSVPVGHSRQQRARAHTRADFYQDDALETVESERIPNFQLLEDDLQGSRPVPLKRRKNTKIQHINFVRRGKKRGEGRKVFVIDDRYRRSKFGHLSGMAPEQNVTLGFVPHVQYLVPVTSIMEGVQGKEDEQQLEPERMGCRLGEPKPGTASEKYLTDEVGCEMLCDLL
ncbi:hypothetical protein RUM43_013413 [Polyplax serrata]|uniref:Uncharacterized protein n=1 Tax=Polyplax serrata TaxID=468196 RepID=A0AAN8PHI8_POLSC